MEKHCSPRRLVYFWTARIPINPASGRYFPSLYLVLHVEDDVADFPLQRRLVEHLLSFAVDFPELVPHYG